MEIRENVGFEIIASHRIGINEEIVFGYNRVSGQYVTWMCSNGDNYYYGHYGTDFIKAVDDYKRRIDNNK